MVNDVVCSWCPIGYANLKKALLNLDIDAEIKFLPYELNPSMGSMGESIEENLERRYNWSKSHQRKYRQDLLEVAGQAGVCMDFSKRTHYYNSNKAHRLMHCSESYNKQEAMNELLIDAYFRLGLDISSLQVLLDLAAQLGMDRSETESVLISNGDDNQLLARKKRVRQFNLKSVPAFIFDESTVCSGSNSVEYFEQVIASLTEKN
jgi:predicted DsbA family dithiol-disulfide isomerase